MVSGNMNTAIVPMTSSHRRWFTPISGMKTIGRTRATMMPDTMTLATLLKTDREPRSLVLRVDSATIWPWLML